MECTPTAATIYFSNSIYISGPYSPTVALLAQQAMYAIYATRPLAIKSTGSRKVEAFRIEQ